MNQMPKARAAELGCNGSHSTGKHGLSLTGHVWMMLRFQLCVPTQRLTIIVLKQMPNKELLVYR